MNHNRNSLKISFIGGLDGTEKQITSQKLQNWSSLKVTTRL